MRIRFHIRTGEEIGRELIPYLNGNRWHMAFSEDGKRAAVTCFGTEPCSPNGWKRAIISVDETGPAEPLDTPVTDNDPLRFPGEPQPSVALTEAARFAADGQRIVFIDANGDVWLKGDEGLLIALLYDDPRPRRAFAYLNALSVSPSGAYVVLLDASHNKPSLLIWETGNGTLLARLDLPPRDYAMDINPTWDPDENHIGIVRHAHEVTGERETALDCPSSDALAQMGVAISGVSASSLG
ncbi:MAG: hypothetical protein IR164_15325 [Devosia sp.]|uniref:hypothetical protein n=1 Tax=Devosia sp. TaxID=1871048 RepID=UPI0019DF064C|nr:hypothetical protein [Devosia sp.]MBF0680296.1 hypothetical protein [Devosia sp.]